MVTISTRIRQLPTLLAIAEAHDDVYCSVGTHPHNARRGARHPGGRDRAPRAAPEGRRHRRGRPRLPLQALLARGAGGGLPPPHRGGARTGLPLEIHTRDADDDTLAILEDEHAKGAFPAILHCYTGGPELARAPSSSASTCRSPASSPSRSRRRCATSRATCRSIACWSRPTRRSSRPSPIAARPTSRPTSCTRRRRSPR